MQISLDNQHCPKGSLKNIFAIIALLALCVLIGCGHLLLQENNMNLGEKIKVREREISKIEERINIVKGELSTLQSQPSMEMRVNTKGLNLTSIVMTQVVRLPEPSPDYGFVKENKK